MKNKVSAPQNPISVWRKCIGFPTLLAGGAIIVSIFVVDWPIHNVVPLLLGGFLILVGGVLALGWDVVKEWRAPTWM